MKSFLARSFPRLKLLVQYKLQGGVQAARAVGVDVGNDCRIYSREFGTEPWLIRIGDRVTISSGVSLLTHDGASSLICDEAGRRYKFAHIGIGSNVFVGIGSILLPGVRIGDNCVIAAGSVVTKSVPNGVVVGGNPARIISTYEEYASKAFLWASEETLSNLEYDEQVKFGTIEGFKPELGETT